MSCGRRRLVNQFVAYLTHPYIDLPEKMAEFKLSSEEENQIFEILKSNKVLLRSLNYNDWKKFKIKSKIISKLINQNYNFRESYNHAQNLEKELLNVIAKFNEKSIHSIFIKSLNTLPLDSDNFDILVKEKDLISAAKVLKEAGFTELPWIREPHKWLFRCVRNGTDYLAVHLHIAVAWQGLKFVDEGDLWRTHRKLKIDGVDIGVPSPEIHLLITFAHAFFENRQFKLSDLTYIIDDIYSKRIDWVYVKNWINKDCWFDSFNGMLLLADHVYSSLFGDPLIPKIAYKKLNGGGRRVSRLSKELIEQYDEKLSLPSGISIIAVACHHVRKIVTDPNTDFINKIGTILSISKDFLAHRMPIRRFRPAFPICFVGQDGTGKTIHARYLWKEFQQREIKAIYIWSRGTGLFLGPLLNLFRFVLLNGKSKDDTNGNGDMKMLGKEPLKSIWALVRLADHLAKSMKVKLALAFGNMVICDRYIFDTFVDAECNWDKNFSETSKRIVEQLVPKPGLVFIMDSEPRQLLKRRSNMDLELVERKRSVYFEYLQKKGDLRIINTCDDLKRNREKILTNALQTYYRYYHANA